MKRLLLRISALVVFTFVISGPVLNAEEAKFCGQVPCCTADGDGCLCSPCFTAGPYCCAAQSISCIGPQ